jgi:Flp pilus assembly protein TadG
MRERSGKGFAAVATPRALVPQGKMMQAKRIRGTGPTHGQGRAGALAALLRRLRRREDGATAIMTGVMATALIGFTGLATEGGSWYVIKRNAQTAADTAAFAGAAEYLANWAPLMTEAQRAAAVAAMVQAARETSARNGYAHGVNNTTVTVEWRPAWSAGHNADTRAVGVVIERTTPLQLAALFLGNDNATIGARAVATSFGLRNNTTCLVALGAGGNGLRVQGTGGVNASGCSLGSNGSITQANAAPVTAFTMSARGTVQTTNIPSNLTLTRTSAPYQPSIIDSFAPGQIAGIPAPDPSKTCQHNSFAVAPDAPTIPAPPPVAMTPGVYCGGINLRGSARLAAGVYHIQGGNLTVASTAKVDRINASARVTFVFTAANPSDIGGPVIDSGATVNLRGGGNSTGLGFYPGVLMYQDARKPVGSEYTLTSGTNIQTTGVFYMPSSDLTISGNFGGTQTCKGFIAGAITVTGSALLRTNLAGCSGLVGLAANQMPMIEVVRLVSDAIAEEE